jgi:hypothetical protein
MKVITSKAEEVVKLMQEREGVDRKAVDPYLIIAIVGCIIGVCQLFINKRNSYKTALAAMQNPSIMQRWTLRRLLKEKLGDQYSSLHTQVKRSMYSMACSLTESDVAEMYHETYKLGEKE